MNVSNLRCESCVNPLGLDTLTPRFSWVLDDTERGQRQSAYQMLVASHPNVLQANTGDVWDSGKVASDRSVNIAYAGKPLTSRQICYWRVRVWDKAGHICPDSPSATFEMGLLRPEDWQGTWISLNSRESPLFRKPFAIEQPVKQARLYIAGVGYYEARLNGVKVGDHVLDPGCADYAKTVLYAAFDVTQMLRGGANILGVMLGNGRFSPPDDVIKKNPRLRRYRTAPCLLAQLEVEYVGGATLEISSDHTWKTTAGPIVFNDLYDGERYDARLDRAGWDIPGYDDADWSNACVVEPPGGQLVSQAAFPSITVSHAMLPRTLTTPQPNMYVYDFGQNFTGWVRLRVNGPRGTEVRIRFAELLHEDGMVNPLPNRSADATDVYILKGEGDEWFEPRFTCHGFRYVELTGFPGTPALENLKGQVVHSAVESTGSFLCSHPLINQLHQNVLWGQRSNLMSVPTDCPQRDERMGWLADVHLAAEEAVYNFRMSGFYTKWIRDLQDAQRADGSVPDVVPPYWEIYPADPAWGSAYLQIPWFVYCYYDDRQILEDAYPMMQAYVAFLNTLAQDDVLSFGKYGDWCPPWHVNSVDTPQELVSQWYYYHDTLLLATIARILGNDRDADEYAARARRIKTAFNRQFLRDDCYGGERQPWYHRLIPETVAGDQRLQMECGLEHSFAVRSQTGHVLALALAVAPADKREGVLGKLVDDIVMHGTHLNTGIIGTRYLLEVLTEHGYADLAFKLVTQTTYPSWGYMLKEGATTLWERWEYLSDAGMNSQNHIMLGCVDAWFYRYLAGIQLDPAAPGWKKIVIKPHVVGDLHFASASLYTVRGLVSSQWTRGCDSLEFQVTVPVNSQAVVSVPTGGLENVTITESGIVIWEYERSQGTVAGITGGRADNAAVTFEVGSGAYHFSVRSYLGEEHGSQG